MVIFKCDLCKVEYQAVMKETGLGEYIYYQNNGQDVLSDGSKCKRCQDLISKAIEEAIVSAELKIIEQAKS